MVRRFVLALTFVAVTFTFAFSETITGKITKVDGTKITFEKSTFDKDTKTVKYDAAKVYDAVNKDVPVTTKAGGKGGAKGKKGAVDPTPVDGGLTNAMFKDIDAAKGVNVTLTTADDGADKGKVTAIAVGGGKGAGIGKKGAVDPNKKGG